MFGPDTHGWARRTHEEVVTHITDQANTLSPEAMKPSVTYAGDTLNEVQADLESILETALAEADDAFLRRQLEAIQQVRVMGTQSARKSLLPSGPLSTRDPTADPVIALAPHQEFIAVVESMQSPYVGLDKLVRLGNQVASEQFLDVLWEPPIPERTILKDAAAAAVPIQAMSGQAARDVADVFDQLATRLEQQMKEEYP